jgi:hypothetical protein
MTTGEPARPHLPEPGVAPDWTPFELEACRRDGCGDERHRHTHDAKLGYCSACACPQFRGHRTPAAWLRHRGAGGPRPA